MIKIILSSFIVSLLCTPFGIYFHKGNDLKSYSLQLIYGVILISFFALSLHFFLPLNKIVNSFLIPFCLIIIYIYRDFYIKRNFVIFCLFSSLIIFLLITNSNVYRPDAGLYHLPYINMLNEEKIIIGNANLHFRFGHISIIQYTSAIMNNILFGVNGIVFAGALIASAIIINFVVNIVSYINQKKLNFHFFYLLSVFIFIIYKMNRYSEYGNDAPAHFLLFFLVSEILKNYDHEKSGQISNYLLLSVFIIMNKVTLINSIIFPLIFIFKKDIFRKSINKNNTFVLLFLFLWCAKNILVSGCLLYPLKISCFESLEWTNVSEANEKATENEAWAKGWPEFREKNLNISQSEYVSNFVWIKTWAYNHFLKIIKILAPYIIFLFVIILFLRTDNNKYEKNNIFKILIIISIIGILIWFYKVPNFRYGYSNIIIFISLIFSAIAYKYSSKNYFNKFKYLVSFLLIIFVLKNLDRIIFENKNYFNYPWPKFYSFNIDNEIENNKIKYINNKKIYTPTNGYCMYGQAPCGEINKNLKIKRKRDYLIFYVY